jgi:hypothetical protein
MAWGVVKKSASVSCGCGCGTCSLKNGSDKIIKSLVDEAIIDRVASDYLAGCGCGDINLEIELDVNDSDEEDD